MNLRTSNRRTKSTAKSALVRQSRLSFETLESRYALVGDFQSAYQVIKNDNNLANIDTAYDSAGNLFVSGAYSTNINFDPTHSPGAPYSEDSLAGFVAKYNTGGELQWVHSFDASSVSEVRGIAIDNSDNVIVAGRFRGTQDFDLSAGTSSLSTVDDFTNNAFVAKYTNSGAFVWAVQGSTTSSAEARDVACDGNGNIYAVGYANGAFNGQTNAGFADAFVWKLSSAGSTQWTNLAGGTSGDYAYSLDVNGGRIAVGGNFSDTITFDTGFTATSQGGWDNYVWMLDTSGATQWAVGAGSTDTFSFEGVQSVSLDSSGKVYALGLLADTADMDPGAGTTTLNPGIFAWQLNANGSFAGAANTDWHAHGLDAIKRGPNGEMYIPVSFSGTVDVDWNTSVRNLTDTSSGDDFALLRYDAQGRLSGVTQIASSDYANLSTVAVNAAGQVAYLVNVRSSTVDLNPGVGTQNVTSTGDFDLYRINLQEATANVSVASTTLNENAGTSTVRVALDRTRSEDVTVNLGFTGSATLNTDYLASSDSIVIPAGQTSGAITLTALNDSAHEVGETIIVNIASLYGARTGATSQATVTLADERARHLGDLVSTTQIVSTNVLTSTVGAFYDASGNLLVVGGASNNGTVNFTPGVTPATTATVGSISNGLIAKYDPNGTLVWSHMLGGSADAKIAAAQLDSQGNLIVAGQLFGTADLDPSAGTTILGNNSYNTTFVAKYSTTGSLLWATQPTASNTNIVFEIAVGPLDEVYVVGRVTGNFNGQSNAGNTDAFAWKIATDGTTQWTKLAGSTGSDQARTIDVNANGTIVVGGEFRSTTTFAPGFTATASGVGDAFVWQLDSTGNTQWVVTAGSTDTFSVDNVNSLVLDDNGRVYVLAYTYGTADMDPGAGIANVSAGFVLWTLNSDGTYRSAVGIPNPAKLVLGPQGDIYVVGDVLSTNDYDLGPGARTVSDSGGATDYVLARYDANGVLTGLSQWNTDVSMQSGMVLAFAPNGKLDVFLNVVSSTVDLDPGAGTQLFNSSGAGNIVRVRLQETAASVSSPSSTLAENGGTSTVRVTLDYTHSEPVTIDLSFGGTATLGVDYSASTNSLVIPAGQTSGSITLTALDDSTYDASETITVSISSTYGALENGAQQITTTITDDDRYVVSGNTLTLLGTSGDDTFMIIRHATNAFYTYIGGEIRVFDTGVIQNVTTNLGSGTDRIEVYGFSGLAETITTGDQTVSYVGGGLTINASNADWIFAFGQSGDTAVMNDSVGNDQFYGLNSYAIALLLGRYTQVTSFGTVTCNSNVGGYDHGWLFGSAGNDSLAMGYTQSTMTSNGYVTQMNNFEYVYGFAVAGGSDIVTHADGSGDDVMYALTGYTILMAPAGFQQSIGFGTTTINSSAGNDQALFYGTSGNELYDGIATKGRMRGTGFDVSANLAKYNYFYGLGGVDTVDLEDSTGNDVFYGGVNVSTLTYASGRLHQIIGNANIATHANLGGNDIAVLDDSAGNDSIDSPSSGKARLNYGNGRSISVEFYDAVYARGTAGGTNTRQASVNSLTGLYFSGTWV